MFKAQHSFHQLHAYHAIQLAQFMCC